MIDTFLVSCCVVCCLFWLKMMFLLRKLTKANNRADALQNELNELATRLYGSPENYERAKENRRECRTDREEKVAREAAAKGIPRSNLQYPSRFKGTR